MNHWQKLGKQIKIRRKQRGWSQKDLGDKIGASFQFVSNLETGNKKYSVDKLSEIANALECELIIEVREV